MGQYHIPVNLTKGQCIYPNRLGDGLKLREFGYSQYGTMTAVAMLLARDNGRGGGDFREHPIIGHWAGDSVIIAGDYGDDGADLPLDWQEQWLMHCRSLQVAAQRRGDGAAIRQAEDWESTRPNLYTFAVNCMLDISAVVVAAMLEDGYLRSVLASEGITPEPAEVERLERLLFKPGSSAGDTTADPDDTSMFNL